MTHLCRSLRETVKQSERMEEHEQSLVVHAGSQRADRIQRGLAKGEHPTSPSLQTDARHRKRRFRVLPREKRGTLVLHRFADGRISRKAFPRHIHEKRFFARHKIKLHDIVEFEVS
jgi:hypothetical protein